MGGGVAGGRGPSPPNAPRVHVPVKRVRQQDGEMTLHPVPTLNVMTEITLSIPGT